MNPFFVICHYIQYISSRNLPTLGTRDHDMPCLLHEQVGQILLHLWRTVCQSEISFPTYKHLHVSYQTQKLLPIQWRFALPNDRVLCRLYIGTNLFIILNSFIIYFYDIGQLLAPLKLLWDKKKKLCNGEGLCLFNLKGME